MTKAKATGISEFLKTSEAKSTMTGVVQIEVFDGNGQKVDIDDIFKYEFTGEDGVIANQTLNTAKKVFSRLAAGMTDYKVAKIAFGNAGHDFDNPKMPVAATAEDDELLSIKRIKVSLNDADPTQHYLYQDGGGTNHRMVYIEKDILPEHIRFGEHDNQFIIEVPISYDDFNARVGAATTNDVEFETATVSYKTLNPSDNTIMEFGNVNNAGVAIKDFTEVHSWDDSGTRRYSFKNGVSSSGAINTVDGGDRPQEISEIFLSTDIVGDGTSESPHEKLGTSRMTTGLLSFPSEFTFKYSWTLSWAFPEED